MPAPPILQMARAFGGRGAAVRRHRLRRRALQLRAAFLAAADRVPDLADRSRHRRRLAPRRKAGRAAGTPVLLAAIGIHVLGVRRGLKSEYFVFTDPLIILAGAILLDRMRDLRFHKWAYPIAATLVGLHLVIAHAEPVKYALQARRPGTGLRMEQISSPAAAAAVVQAARNGVIERLVETATVIASKINEQLTGLLRRRRSSQ